MELISTLEELAADAWQPAEVELLDGWRLRFCHGVTRRANSVLASGHDGTLSLEEKLARVEAFYAARGLPARFQLSPVSQPSGLDQFLAARGYGCVDRTDIQVASLPLPFQRHSWRVEVSPSLPDPWWASYCAAECFSTEVAEVRRRILGRIQAVTGYAVALTENAEPAAVGVGGVSGSWLGIFCMATRPEYRRKGAARAVLGALTEWGSGQGATDAYLQVFSENLAAITLYQALGFRTLYSYFLCERQPAGNPR